MVQDAKWSMVGIEPQMTGITWPEKLLRNITIHNKRNEIGLLG